MNKIRPTRVEAHADLDPASHLPLSVEIGSNERGIASNVVYNNPNWL